MPERSLAGAFDVFLQRQVPTQTERDAAVSHRGAVRSVLEDKLDVVTMFETGSFIHGTGVRSHSDVDVLVWLNGLRPSSPDTALAAVKSVLAARFPYTSVRISRPAVVVDFAGGDEPWEVIPGYWARDVGDDEVYRIPAPGGTWMETCPTAHLKYVTRVNASPAGGAKGLARLVKAWKYLNVNRFKVSSFYLEMCAAKRMSWRESFSPLVDFVYMLEELAAGGLAPISDPTGVTEPFRATSTASQRDTALALVKSDAQYARAGLEAELNGDRETAFKSFNHVFVGAFPSRLY